MKQLAVVFVLLGACGKPDEDYKKEKPPEPEEVKAAEKKPPPPPPKKALTDEELGKCELKVTGTFKFEQTTHGGIKATNVSYWMSEADQKNMTGVDGFAVNCKGTDIKFSIVPGGGKKDGMPFAPKKYTFKKGVGDAGLLINLGPKHTMAEPNGYVDITAFDKSHIAGTINLSGKTVPGNGNATLTGSFDFKCPGFSGCE